MDTRFVSRRSTTAGLLTLASGGILYRQGQVERHVYVVESGHLKLEHIDAVGRTSISAILGVGQILGPGLGGVGQASHTATAKGEAQLQCYTAAAFTACLQDDGALMSQVIEMLAQRQEITERRLYAVLTLDVRGRIAVVLRDLVGLAGGHCVHGHEVDVPLTQQELAELIGASRPVVSSALNALRREGLLEYARGHICVNDLKVLESVANNLLADC